MVHTKASTGCQKCRDRHIKCDEARPRCRKCLSQGHTCPGYQDVGGIIFKDVTRRVCDKQVKRAKAAERALLKVSILSRPRRLLLEPPIDDRSFFYHTYVLSAAQDPSPTTGFFEHVLPLSSSAAPSSALDLAVSLMINRAVCLYHGRQQTSSWHIQKEVAAIEAIRAAVADPHEATKDETLLAVLCAAFAETLAGRAATLRGGVRAHVEGALALVRHREVESFASKASYSLWTATRSHVLLQDLWFPEDVETQNLILLLPDVEPRDPNPGVSIHGLLVRALIIQRWLFGYGVCDPPDECGGRMSTLRCQAQTLCEELVQWHLELPREWAVSSISHRPNIPLHMQSNSTYAPAEVAYVSASWHCTYLIALKLAFGTVTLDDTMDNSRASALQDILENTQQVVDSLLYLVVPLLDPTDTGWTPKLKNKDKTHVPGLGAYMPNRSRHLANILSWMLTTLTEEQPGSEEFGVRPDTMEYLLKWHKMALGYA